MNRITTYLFMLMGFLVVFLGSAQAQDVVIVTSNPLWTNTGVFVYAGDTVDITASGSWTWGGAWHGPDGAEPWSYPNTWDRFLYQANHGELIAYVGQDPYQGHWGDSSFFPQTTGYWAIGSEGQFVSHKTGILWLGFNDDSRSGGRGDNAGYVTAQIEVTPPVIIVSIDIKPGSDTNPINIDSNGVIPVAILTTEEFDAAYVNPGTLMFGPAGAYPESFSLEDVDYDGDIDMVLHFSTQNAGIGPEDTGAVIEGETYDGLLIEGTDSVWVLGNKGKKK